jgi:hypothetical protein
MDHAVRMLHTIMRIIRDIKFLRTERNKKKPVSDPVEVLRAVLNEKEHVMYHLQYNVVISKGAEVEEIISPSLYCEKKSEEVSLDEHDVGT